MLTISQEQMKVHREALETALENRLFEHASSTYPKPLRLFGPDCIRQLIRVAIKKTRKCLLVSEEADRLVLRLILECGVDFDTDPALDFPGPILTAPSPERQRLAQLAAAADRYSAATAPAMRSAAFRFRNFPTAWSGHAQERYLNELIDCCTAVFPEKAALVPTAAWPLLSKMATSSTADFGWRTITAHAVLFSLFFLAGSGFPTDPRFAFVSSVTAEPPADPGVALHQLAAGTFEQWFADTK